MKVDLVFCGKLGSGKTQVSRAVASATGARWNSFSSIVKRIATERKIPLVRERLQALGEELVEKRPEEFCRRVLDEAEPKGEEAIVIDGLRHKEIHAVLQRLLSPRRLLCVFVDVTEGVRVERLKRRDNVTEDEIHRLEGHSTEVQVAQEMRALANYVVDNSGDLQAAVKNILAWMSTPNGPVVA